jgi:osmotically-inducible protein OsmY
MRPDKLIILFVSMTVGLISLAAVKSNDVRSLRTIAQVDTSALSNEIKTENENLSDEDQQAQALNADLTRQFRAALLEDPTISPWGKNIEIAVDEGEIKLQGFVRSTDERTRIERLAETLPGIVEVKNDLSVNTPYSMDNVPR